MIGLIIWRMVILGIYIWGLGKKFYIKPRLGDPDGCGGLEPLGNLCLLNALIVSIAGVYLGGWIILAHVPQPGLGDPLQSSWLLADEFVNLYFWLALIPIALSTICFVLPLWSIHQEMQAKAETLKQEMENMGN